MSVPVTQCINVNTENTDPWSLLHAEFDAWHRSGKPARLWWRDDDAAVTGPKLDQLIRVSANAGLLLAVIPKLCEKTLCSLFSEAPLLRIAQHGYAHINHAPRGQGLGAWELGMHRGIDAVLADLDRGRERLEDYFGDFFLPVVVPPWNKIDPLLFAPLAERGYSAVSTFGARTSVQIADGLLAVNAHCDPIRWKSGAQFAGELKTINQLVDHLRAKRIGLADTDEPSGFLTHHVDLDEQGWQFCQQLTDCVEQHAGAQWVPPSELFMRNL